MEFNIEQITRENIRKMTPYSSARHEFSGTASVFLDANENAFGSPLPESYNRYPDPLQQNLKDKISRIKGVPSENIFLGNGSDEAIDLLFRIFCEPGKDNVIIFPPTYGMYEVCAEVNNVEVRKVPLLENYQLNLDAAEQAVDENTKLIFVCSPNNPTGNSIYKNDIEILLNNFNGLVVVDEAYINYAKQKTLISELTEYPNLVILQTLSKAWGLAGLRLGMAFASKNVIDYFNKVKYPYNINTATQNLALEALNNITGVNNWIRTTVTQREWLANELTALPFTQLVHPSDANFLLVKMINAKGIYDYLTGKGIIVRDRSKVILCEDCLRITIGTPEENKQLIEILKTL
ncbi:MAG TPA: histidinol-phosphate transaminase [Chitinophagaceae bacterium]|jgi:histidinol-phosphate aminotransferase|nr:histidinol-phosphate transaminase [Chitinophagaceae bacterium]HMU57236.1 histidinol-phosphate transaminase [Chitinophagaceae bacterium]